MQRWRSLVITTRTPRTRALQILWLGLVAFCCLQARGAQHDDRNRRPSDSNCPARDHTSFDLTHTRRVHVETDCQVVRGTLLARRVVGLARRSLEFERTDAARPRRVRVVRVPHAPSAGTNSRSWLNRSGSVGARARVSPSALRNAVPRGSLAMACTDARRCQAAVARRAAEGGVKAAPIGATPCASAIWPVLSFSPTSLSLPCAV